MRRRTDRSGRFPVRGFLALAALGFTLLGAVPSSEAGATPVAVLPAKLDDYVMAVQGEVSGKMLWWDVDTGGTHSFIDATVAKLLHLPVAGALDVKGAGAGSVKGMRLAPADVKLRTLSLRLNDVLAVDLSPAGSAIGARGLIGFELFQRYVVAYDYDRKTIALYEPKTYVYGGAGSRVPLVIRPPRAFVWVTVAAPGVAPERHLLRVDTGSSDSVDDDIVLRSTEPKKTITGGVGIGTARFRTYLAPLSSLQIGPYTLHRDLQSATGGAQLVGSDVWHRFNVVFDFSRRCMYLTPREP